VSGAVPSLRPWVHPDLAFWVHRPRGERDWDQLAAEYTDTDLNKEEERRPLNQVFDVVAKGGCMTVVVENRYVDIDYRSEYTAFWSRKFDNQSPFARRFHFFAVDLDEATLHDLTETQRRSYLGYSIIRPVPHGRVGRTVLKPPPDLDATLTLIDDQVSFFGNPLIVRGVPFCEQDKEFLRCAHAAAWICHYTAARRGNVGRHSTAEIVEMSPGALSPERALPSQGLNYNQLQVAFGELGQPAIVYGLSNLPQVVGVEDPETPDEEDAAEQTPAGWWDGRIVSIICRYLNSGFPVLVGAEEHAFVLVGWRRDDEGSVQFIACDDGVGPYEVISSPFEHRLTPWDSFMIPLPPKVYLSAESAETRAHESFYFFAEKVEQLHGFKEELLDGRIVLRTMLRSGARYKDEVKRVTRSPQTLQALRLARLPHWVWVVEAHRPDLCVKGEPCVVGAAVLDSTAFDEKPPVDILAVLGMVMIYPPDDADEVSVPGSPTPWESLLKVH
jgi:hypothetical protein